MCVCVCVGVSVCVCLCVFVCDQSKARQLVEQAWGQLVKRFPLLSRTSLWVGKTWQGLARAILTCMVLHNLCKNVGDEWEWVPYFVEEVNDDLEAVDAEILQARMFIVNYVSQFWKLDGNNQAVRK